jgi:hypothetical protein
MEKSRSAAIIDFVRHIGYVQSRWHLFMIRYIYTLAFMNGVYIMKKQSSLFLHSPVHTESTTTAAVIDSLFHIQYRKVFNLACPVTPHPDYCQNCLVNFRKSDGCITVAFVQSSYVGSRKLFECVNLQFGGYFFGIFGKLI